MAGEARKALKTLGRFLFSFRRSTVTDQWRRPTAGAKRGRRRGWTITSGFGCPVADHCYRQPSTDAVAGAWHFVSIVMLKSS